MHNTILHRVKNVKMINLDEDLPLYHTSTPFFNFSDSSSLGYLPKLKRGLGLAFGALFWHDFSINMFFI